MIILRNTTEGQTVYVPRNSGGMTQKRYLTSEDLKTVQGESLVGSGNIQIDVPTKTSELVNDSGYTDKNYVDSKLAMKADRTEVEAELNKKADITALGSYALKTDVPTKTSQLTNDSGFVGTEALGNYATKEELDGKVDKVEGKGLSANDYTDADKDKVQRALTEHQSLEEYYTKTESDGKYATKTELDGKVDKTELGSYALKSDVPTKTSQLTNDSGFVDDEALAGYATKTELDDYATKAEVPDKTSELTNDSDYTTTSYVDTKITEALGTVENKLSTI